eukprot:5431328-Prymnesium_polylepis.1
MLVGGREPQRQQRQFAYANERSAAELKAAHDAASDTQERLRKDFQADLKEQCVARSSSRSCAASSAASVSSPTQRRRVWRA